MTIHIDIHPEAMEEARVANRWYRKKSVSAGEAFRAEFLKAMETIRGNPRTWPRFDFGTRRYVLSRFPFSIIYLEYPRRIEIIAIAHGSRRPGYWKERVS